MRFAKWQRMREGSMNKASAGEANGRLEEFRRGRVLYRPPLHHSFAL